jgi:5-dehydro-2-deoxygluconokinase
MQFDTLHMGRSGIDLYSNNVGAPFPEISEFAAYVGGSPTNIAVGARRLGLNSALLTGLGYDPVGDFILHFLRKEGVNVDFSVRKAGTRSGAVLLGIEPPDKFPLIFYRENAADAQLSIDDVLAAPVRQSKIFQFAGTNLAKDPARSATLYAVEVAKAAGNEVVLDVDFRPDQWHDPRAFGVAIRSCLPLVDIVIGTEDEINAAMLTDASAMRLTHSQVSDTRVSGDVHAAIRRILALGPLAVIEKVGEKGSRIHLRAGNDRGDVIEAPGYPVQVANILGAGDAFAAGFLYGRVQRWDWRTCARLGNACGAILVTQHGCSAFMPTLADVMAFVGERGGLE